MFKIAIYGPSDEIFVWWGHAALIVEYTKSNLSWVFDWGVNSHPNDSFLKDFIKKQVQYEVSSNLLNLNKYINDDRDIAVYTLNLDRKAKEVILAYAENKVMLENCYYDYHEFRDNCSTGVRDIIDLGTGGQFKAAFSSVPGRFTYRQHARRYTWFRPLSEWFLNFLMGQNLDKKITVWDEMFLPVEIAKNIVDFSYIDDSGAERKMVSSAQIIYSSEHRPPILNDPLAMWPFFLTAGLIFMALLFFIDAMHKKYQRCIRIIWSLIQSILGLLFGAAGYILFFGLFINKDYIQHNINVWFLNPLLLIIVPLGILSAANKSFLINPDRLLRIIWTYVFIAGSITLFLGVLPFFYQENESVCALILPIAFALSNVPRSLLKLRCHFFRASALKA